MELVRTVRTGRSRPGGAAVVAGALALAVAMVGGAAPGRTAVGERVDVKAAGRR